ALGRALGEDDHDARVEVALLARLPARAEAAQAEALAALRAGRDLQAHLARRRGEVDLAPAHRLDDRDRHLDVQVVALAPIEGVLRDLQPQVQVAGRGAGLARLAQARQP